MGTPASRLCVGDAGAGPRLPRRRDSGGSLRLRGHPLQWPISA